jgi:hypothetical protein
MSYCFLVATPAQKKSKEHQLSKNAPNLSKSLILELQFMAD